MLLGWPVAQWHSDDFTSEVPLGLYFTIVSLSHPPSVLVQWLLYL